MSFHALRILFSCADHARFVGVAPEANLLSFKVFSRDGYSNEETVIEGFLKAFESGVSDHSHPIRHYYQTKF